MTRFWTGGYGPEMEGQADGIGLLAVDEGQGPTTLAYRGAVVPAPSPSWLAQHPTLDVVYAALEGSGEVAAFARTGESALRPLGSPVPAGELVCHLAVAPDGRFLIASCYGDGRVVRIGLGADGRLVPEGRDKAAELRAALFGGGDASERREESRPAGEAPGSAQRRNSPRTAERSPEPPWIHTPRIRTRRTRTADPKSGERIRMRTRRRSCTTAGSRRPTSAMTSCASGVPAQAALIPDHEVVLPRGSGPRHMVVHPSGHLHVVTEYSCEVFTLAADREGRWGLVAGTLVSEIATPGHDYPAELSRSRDGETLYAGVRGSNTIAALRVRGSGERVEPLALADSGVDWPRHHLVHDGALLVAGQRSDEISVLDLDDRTGAPVRIRHRTPAPTPTHVLLVR